MLYAVAIYTSPQDSSEEFKKIQFSQLNKSRLFPSNDLKSLEEMTLKRLPKPLEAIIYHVRIEDELHYVKRGNNNTVLAIVSRKDLDEKELSYLFGNIEHTQHADRATKLKISLDLIIQNPLGYIGRDALTGRINDDIEKIKGKMRENIELAIRNRESIDELTKKTIILEESAGDFHKKAKELNSCSSRYC
jgi:hypothetical protein